MSSAAGATDETTSLPLVLTTEEAAQLLRVDVETLELMVVAGTIPARKIRIGDGAEVTRFGRDSLLEWLQQPSAARIDEPADTTNSVSIDETLGQDAGRTSTDVFLGEQGVLPTAGQLSFDLGTFYARQDGDVLAVEDDAFVLATVTGRTGLVQGSFRFSSSDAVELFVRAGAERIDARLRRSDGYSPLGGADSRTRLAAGVRRVLYNEAAGRPEVILGLEARLPTGTSSIGLGTSVSLIKNLDPAVVFGSITYGFVDGEAFAETNLLESRHSLNADIGYALALNDRFSVNFSMEAGYRSRTQFDDTILLDDDHAGLQFGMTMKLSPTLFLQPVVGFSLIGGGYSIGVSIPIGR